MPIIEVPGAGAVVDGPCDPWPVIWCEDLTDVDPIITGAALQAATETLWARSGRRFGTCTVDFRPCRRDCWGSGGPWPFRNWFEWTASYPMPFLYAGAWFNLGCGSCGDNCGCGRLSEFMLPGPVAEIVAIVIDGEMMPTGSYRVDDWRKVVRTDGGEWPVCQDLSADDGPGTWIVTASIGEAVPTLGQMAVGELAEEIVKGCTDGQCRLPWRPVEVNRAGVVKRFPTPAELLKDGQIGLPLSDLFLTTYNPNRLHSRPLVVSPDVRVPRRAGT